MSGSNRMRIHTVRFKTGDAFLREVRDLEGEAGLRIRTRARFEPSERLVVEVRFPPMGNGVLVKAEAARVDVADDSVLVRLEAGERRKWDFLLSLAESTRSPPRRRRYPRFPVDLPAVWQVRGTELRHRGRVKDLSRGGVFVETDLPPPGGTELKLTVPFEAGEDPLTLYGRVTRVRHARRGGGMGIRLRYRTTGSMRRLRSLLRSMNDTGELAALPEPTADPPSPGVHVQG